MVNCSLLSEVVTAKRSKGEILVFPRGQIPKELKAKGPNDVESQPEKSNLGRKPAEFGGSADTTIIQRQTAVFTWRDVIFDIKIKKEARRILDHVDGWVKPGTLTALMAS